MTTNQRAPWIPLTWAGLAFLIIIGLMFETAASAVSIWERSSTFTHGYFILPIFLWLVWRKGEFLATLPSRPDWLPIPLILGSGLVWLLAGIAGIQFGQHVALVMIIIFSFWAVVGRDIASHLKFPLAFLFFMAPVGEELVPLLMDVTANFTVGAIKLTGIPIYREGLFFSLPSGNWSVVEACSGIRYLIASMTLGTLYAYLNYDSTQRRLLFITLSAIVPIIANGIRAFMIVMIGHHSDMKLATGVDHLVYGWLFFGVVMFMLFSLGALFSEPANKTTSGSQQKNDESLLGDTLYTRIAKNSMPVATTAKFGHFAGFAILVAVCVAAWPAWTMAMNWSAETSALTISEMDAILPDSEIISPDALQGTSDAAAWSPHISGYDSHLQTLIEQRNLPTIEAYAFVYVTQTQGKEMISSANVLVKSKDDYWRTKDTHSFNLSAPSGITFPVKQSILVSEQKELVVWQWYAIGDKKTVSPLQAKLMEVTDQLLLRKSLSVVYMLVVDHELEGWEKSLTEVTFNIVDKGK